MMAGDGLAHPHLLHVCLVLAAAAVRAAAMVYVSYVRVCVCVSWFIKSGSHESKRSRRSKNPTARQCPCFPCVVCPVVCVRVCIECV